MTRADVTLVAAIYLPVCLATAAGFVNGRIPRQFPACLLSLLWVTPALWALQRVNEWAGWWTFKGGTMPLELYVGWITLWGILPQLAFPRLPLALVAVFMLVADLLGMPLCSAVVILGRHWLIGEAIAIIVVLLPALCIARWTLTDTRLYYRAALQVAISGMLFLYFFPEIAFTLKPGSGWAILLQMPRWEWQLWTQLITLLALPGAGAVMEFAVRGEGTPIPYDPPKRLVTSGLYRYCSNPMQICCGLTMLTWALMLRNVWLLLGALVSFIYSAGIAEWDERQDLQPRFGEDWLKYRREVKSWVPRWKPYVAGPPSRLYIAGTCGPCSELRAWLECRQPIGLELIAAETLEQGSIRRLRYVAADGTETVEGVRALGRAMEHLQFGWALTGTALRLPGICQAIQLLTDVSGLGPRQITGVSTKV